MSVHVLIEIKILDKAMYEQYIKQVPSIVKQYGGRYLIRGGMITTIAGDWHPERLILLEFDNAGQVHNWLTSSEYAEVAPLRINSTITNAVMIESDVLP